MLSKKILLWLIAILISTTVFGQIPSLVQELNQNDKTYISDLKPDERAVLVSTALLEHGFNRLDQLNLNIEIGNDSKVRTYQFKENDIYSSDFELILSSGRKAKLERGNHYAGRSEDGDLIALSVFKDQVIGLIIDKGVTYELEPFSDKKTSQNIYKLVRAKSLPEELRRFCHTDEVKSPLLPPEENNREFQVLKSAGPVTLYLECDNQTFIDFSSDVTETTNYITGLMNVVFSLFAAENVTVDLPLQAIKIWDTPDPYGAADNGATSATVLDNFSCNLPVYNGRLAHLVSTVPAGLGGRANQPSFDYCPSKQPNYGFSEIYTSYDTDLSNYSWSINVLAHEIGHQLGAHHTHDCVWNDNNTQIDDCGNILSVIQNLTPNSCYNPNSQILPNAGQGTIMSYCHTDGGDGINLALGFHDQVGARMSTFANSCIAPKTLCPLPAMSSLEVEILSSSSVRFSNSLPTNNFWVIGYFATDGSTGIICNNDCNSVAVASDITISGLDDTKTYLFQFTQFCDSFNDWSAWSCFYSLEDLSSDTIVDCTTDNGTVNANNANMDIISSANVLMTNGPVNVTSATPITWQSKQSIQLNNNFSIGPQVQLNFSVGDCKED